MTNVGSDGRAGSGLINNVGHDGVVREIHDTPKCRARLPFSVIPAGHQRGSIRGNTQMDARLNMSGMTEGDLKMDARLQTSGMTEKAFSRLTPHFLLFTSSYDRLRIAYVGNDQFMRGKHA